MNAAPEKTSGLRRTAKPFGKTDEGTATVYSLMNAQGTRVEITNLGAIIVSLWTADRHGQGADIVLGFDEPQSYLERGGRFGAVVGRYAGRIAGACFKIQGEAYHLVPNEGPNHLHGGALGLDRRLWQAEAFHTTEAIGLRLFIESPDGEEGFPGRLYVTVTYRLDNDDRLTVDYEAVSNKPTIINLTQHSYFNLGGHQNRDIATHRLFIAADSFLPVDNAMLPTGHILSVRDTPMDFRQPKAIGRDMDAPQDQLLIAGGYDHTWVLARRKQPAPSLAARVYHPESGRWLTVSTDQPGLQFYTGNGLDGSTIGKGHTDYRRHQGFCLETQNFPDAPNRPDFPSPLLMPGDTFTSRTIFHFGAQT